MFARNCQRSTPPSFRSVLPGLLAATIGLTLAACGSAGDALAPSSTDQQLAPADATLASGDAPLATTSESAGPDLTALSTTQRIAFTSTRKGGYDIYKMDPQGYNVTALTSAATWEFSPAWSWDNQHIALLRSRVDASNVSHYDVWVINADGSNGHWARSTASKYDVGTPTWSPDGTQLAVSYSISGVWYVGWMNLVNGQIGIYSSVAGGLKGRYPSYTASGKIVYMGGTGMTIDQINADGSNHKVLVASTNVGVAEPVVSRDGTKVAFDKLIGFNMDIYVKNLVDGTTKRLTTYSGFDTHPSWSPDGTKIAFTSQRSGQWQIWTMDAATGGSVTRITHTSTVERDAAWSH